jgi:hypothetical protein
MSLDTYVVCKTGNSLYEVKRYKAGALLESTTVDLMKNARNDYEIKRQSIARRYASEGCPAGAAYWFTETGAISKTTVKVAIEESTTRKHFQAAAGAIKAISDPKERQKMADFQAQIFSKDNPRFDHVRFHNAAGTKYGEQ